MIWQTNRSWKLEVRLCDAATLKKTTFQEGAELLSKIIAAISRAGFKIDLAQLYKTNLFDILQGSRTISAWAPRPANAIEEKRLRTQIEVPLEEFKFLIAKPTHESSTEVKETPHKFLLSIHDNEGNEKDKEEWGKMIAALQYGQGQGFLEELVNAICVSGFKADVAELWRTDPSYLRQGKINVFRCDGQEVAPTVSLQVSSKSWFFTVKRTG